MAIVKAPKRIVRGGVLIAFAGERMSEAEAKRRGILDEIKAADAPEAEPADEAADAPEEADFDGMTVADLKAYIEANGGEAKPKAVKADLVEIAKAL